MVSHRVHPIEFKVWRLFLRFIEHDGDAAYSEGLACPVLDLEISVLFCGEQLHEIQIQCHSCPADRWKIGWNTCSDGFERWPCRRRQSVCGWDDDRPATLGDPCLLPIDLLPQ